MARTHLRHVVTLVVLASVLFCTLPLSAFSESLSPVEAGSMEATVEISNKVLFEIDGPNYRVEDAIGRLSWFPKENFLQTVETFSITPSGQRLSDEIIFSWDHPNEVEMFRVTANVKTKNAVIPVFERIPFPLQHVPQEITPYLEFAEIADNSPEIQELAQQLASGKNDAYEVVFALADWTTNNVEYSLNSIGQPAIQSSSEVIASRWGKCDELTALFISLNRAVGIPARFVAGYSYTESELFDEPWGGHGWAEVWLPNVGWVPFDVTYGEYGYLDASHVVLKVSNDAKENSIEYTAKGSDFKLQTEPLNIVITPKKLVPYQGSTILLSLSSPSQNVGFGSAVLLLAVVENTKNYYVSTRLDLARTSNTNTLSDTYKNILLKPYEKRTVPFLVKIDDDLKPGYQYEFPFILTSRLGDETEITIRVQQGSPVYDESAFASTLAEYSSKVRPAQDLVVTCDRGEPVYVGERTLHSCRVIGLPAGVEELQICDAQKIFCEKKTITENSFPFSVTSSVAGIATQEFLAVAENRQGAFFVTTKNVLPANISLDLSAPNSTTPDQAVDFFVALDHTGALPVEVTVSLNVNHVYLEKKFAVLDRPAKITFSIPGRAFRPGENTVSIDVRYKDELGTADTVHQEWILELTGVGIFDRIGFLLEDLVALLP